MGVSCCAESMLASEFPPVSSAAGAFDGVKSGLPVFLVVKDRRLPCGGQVVPAPCLEDRPAPLYHLSAP